MKKFTISCVALAMVWGACLTAEAQNRNRGWNPNRGIGSHIERWRGGRHHDDDDDDEYVYDITYTVHKFRGYKYVRINAFNGDPRPLGYSVRYSISADGQSVSGTDNINKGSAGRMVYYNLNGATKTMRGVDPQAKIRLSSTAKVAGADAVGPPPQTKSINPRGETVWLNGKDYQVAITYRVTKRKVR